MQFVILGMLLGEPLSLYDLRQRFARVVSLFYSASFGSIQRALRSLVEAGHVTLEAEPGSARGKKLYRVTVEGRTTWRTLMLAPLSGSDLEKTMLAKIFFLGRLDAAADRARVLAAVRERVEGDLARLRALAGPGAPVADPVAGYQFATLDYGLRTLEVARDWVDELAAAEAAR